MLTIMNKIFSFDYELLQRLLTVKFFLSISRMSDDKVNPWSVPNVDAFLYYCCPECNERNQSRELFLKHAFEVHPSSKDSLVDVCVKVETVYEQVDYYEDPTYDVKSELGEVVHPALNSETDLDLDWDNFKTTVFKNEV